MTALRILIATPLRTGRTKNGRNLGTALTRLGHEVFYFDYDDQPWSLRLTPRALRFGDWRGRQRAWVNARVLAEVARLRPTLFLCVKGLQFTPETLQGIAAGGTITAGYWIDDPLQHERSVALASHYQHYFTNDEASVPKYRALGFGHVHHLPSSADPEMFFPLPQARPVADVIFVGTRTDYRESILAQLTDLDLRVYGPGWKRSTLPQHLSFGPAFGAKTNWVYNHARVNLNIHGWFGQGSAMNLRCFEVPAAGAFLLTDWVAEIDTAYREGEHLACYRSVDELRDKLRFYLAQPEARARIAAAGREHFLAHHSYEARARELLARIGLGGQPPSAP